MGSAETRVGDSGGASVVSLPGCTGPPAEVRGKIGRFTLLRQVGRGGMGVVYAAYDEKLDRRLAIKVLLKRMGKTARSRVQREARAMAKLDHPGVVSIYEVGEDHGEIYLAMEFVDGATLDQWRRDARRSWREVLAVYRQAAEALAAAHSVGLVHRDFKPQNAMVRTDHAGGLSVKVLDFGLVRSCETVSSAPPDSVDDDALAAAGSGWDERLTVEGRLTGTPAFMAPEQFASAAVDERADQFSFCVALWEALYGEAPYPGATPTELFCAMQDGELRPPPRGTDVPSWVRDALVRGLALDPRNRWPTMAALTTALDHDPPWGYRWVAAGAVGAALIGGVAILAMPATGEAQCTGAERHLEGVWGASERDSVRAAIGNSGVSYGEDTANRVSASLDAYARSWAEMHREACEATTIRGEQSEALLDLRMACLDRARMRLRSASRVLAQADADVVSNAHSVVGQLPALEECANLDALAREQDLPPPEVFAEVDAVQSLLSDASAEIAAGRFGRALSAVAEAQRLADASGHETTIIEVKIAEGEALVANGELEPARRSLEEGLAKATRVGQRRLMAEASTNLMSLVGFRLQRPAESTEVYELLSRELSAHDPRARADYLSHLALVRFAQGEYEVAKDTFSKSIELHEELDADEVQLTALRDGLAVSLQELGLNREAERVHRENLEARRRLVGDLHPLIGQSHNNLGIALEGQGRNEEAYAEYGEAVRIFESTVGVEHPSLGSVLNNLSNSLNALGRYEEAIEASRRAIRIIEGSSGTDSATAAMMRVNLAENLRRVGKKDEALVNLRRAKDVILQTHGDRHPVLGSAAMAHGHLLVGRGELDEAQAEFELAEDIYRASHGAGHPYTVEAQVALAELLAQRGQLERSHEVASKALTEISPEQLDPELVTRLSTAVEKSRRASDASR